MASTNKTTNYNLSQFLGTDKPAWLADYNSDMTKIDGGIHTAQTTATGADGKADANTTAIGTLANLTTDAKTDLVVAVNEVDAHADVAQSTANTASNNASTALTKANQAMANVDNLNLTTFDTVTVTGANVSSSANTLTVAKNSDGSICKIYGNIESTYKGSTSTTWTTGDTGLRPANPITIQGCMLRRAQVSSDSSHRIFYQTFTINTNGTITWENGSDAIYSRINWMFMASLIFVKDFGDLPAPE